MALPFVLDTIKKGRRWLLLPTLSEKGRACLPVGRMRMYSNVKPPPGFGHEGGKMRKIKLLIINYI